MSYTQENRLIAIHTPLGEDVLLLREFTGQEGISQLFRFQLDLLSEDPAIAFDQLIGQRVTISIDLADGSERYIDGFISRFAQSTSDAQFTYYEAEVVPWLWFLTHTADCRIFQNMTIPDIIMKIFQDLGFSDVKMMLQGQFEPREYCVQYRETDFNFVSRLMEQYGIFYFFTHEKNKHTLVLCNTPSAHQPCPGQAFARCDFSDGAMQEFRPGKYALTDYNFETPSTGLEEDVITHWHKEQEFRPGKYALTDYNFETPSTGLAVNIDSTVTVDSNSKYEIYEYPGEYLKRAQGEELVKIRMEEEEASYTMLTGASTCRAFSAGCRFDLQGHFNQAMNSAYLLTELHHNASVGSSYAMGGGSGGDEQYTNTFTCIPYNVPYRPPRLTPKPIVQGPQTAIVVGKADEEIWTDGYGRVKVQFHWDREGERNENSSCWIRVSHPWAGKNWGAIYIPRMGQEVIVDFLEGDPDQPIITGRVYNAEQRPPYTLPANQTQSGIKSRSSKGGSPENFNEIRFEDDKGKEEIYVHAERNLRTVVEVSENRSIGSSRTTTIHKEDETLVITEGDRSETLEQGSDSLTIQQGDRNADILQGNDILFVQTGNIEQSAPAGTFRVDANDIALTGVTSIKLICGASKIEITSASITITSPIVKINC